MAEMTRWTSLKYQTIHGICSKEGIVPYCKHRHSKYQRLKKYDLQGVPDHIICHRLKLTEEALKIARSNIHNFG